MTVEMREVTEGVIIAVQAQPGARRNAVTGVHDGRLKVAVTQVAEKGKANQEIIRLLAKELGVSKSAIQVISGETGSKKGLLVQGLSMFELTERIQALLQ